jgi:hypothetical protein
MLLIINCDEVRNKEEAVVTCRQALDDHLNKMMTKKTELLLEKIIPA